MGPIHLSIAIKPLAPGPYMQTAAKDKLIANEKNVNCPLLLTFEMEIYTSISLTPTLRKQDAEQHFVCFLHYDYRASY